MSCKPVSVAILYLGGYAQACMTPDHWTCLSAALQKVWLQLLAVVELKVTLTEGPYKDAVGEVSCLGQLHRRCLYIQCTHSVGCSLCVISSLEGQSLSWPSRVRQACRVPGQVCMLARAITT